MIRSDDRGHVRMMSRVDGVAGRGRRSWLFWLAAAALVCAVAASWGWMGEWLGSHLAGDSSAPELDRLFTVRKGGFKIEFKADGAFSELKRHNIIFSARQQEGELRITKVVKDKTPVKKGDVVIEISRESHLQRLDQLKQELETSYKDLALSREELEIKKSGNIADIKNSVNALNQAEEALAQYRDMEAKKRKKQLSNAIDDAIDKYDAAVAKLKEARENKNAVQAGGTKDEELEQFERQVNESRQQVEQAQSSLDEAQYQLRVFRQYEHPQKMDSLLEAVTRAKLELEDAIVNAKGSVVQEESKILNLYNRISQIKSKTKEVNNDLDNLELRAPADGIINLGPPENQRYGAFQELPQVGTSVYPGQILATIPVLSKMIVRTKIPEAHRSKIQEGLLTHISAPAIGNVNMAGKIKSIAYMAENSNSSDGSGGTKYYPTEIEITRVDPRLVPGLSAKVEIIVEDVQNALYVPLESVYARAGMTWCKVLKGGQTIEKEVETGRSSLHYVEILSGLEEGDQVLLAPNDSGV